MIRSTESLTSTTELDVSAYSKVLLQPEAACNAVVQGSTTTSGNLWDVVPVKVYASGVESLGNGGPVLANNIVEVPCEGLARIKVSGLASTTTVRVTRVPFDNSLIVAAASEASVRAAIEYMNSIGGGTVQVLRGTITLTSPLPLYDGVKVVGTSLGALTFTSIPDSFWNFDTADITLFVGDGTFNAFQHNATGTGTLPTVQADFSNEMITNFGLESLAFDNFTCAVQVGAQNKGGGFLFHMRDLLIKNTKTWGIRLTNSMHYEVERIHVVNSFAGGAALFEGDCPDTILQTGNCFIRHIFACPNGDATGNTAKQRRLAKGVEFRASHSGAGTGILNEVHVYGLQVNMFNRVGLSETATFTNGSANIGVADGTEYAVGMPVRFTTTPAANFATNKIYVVRSVVGNNIQLALDRTSALISAGSSTTATMLCNGQPALAVYGDTATSRVNNSDFYALDLEGGYAAGLYADRPGTSEFVINQFGSLANNVDIVARNCSNVAFKTLNTAVTDIDSASSAGYFTGRQTMLDRPGKGFHFETALNAHTLSVGGSGISGVRMTPGDGFRMAANAGFGLQFTGRTASLTMTNNHFGLITITGTTAGQNITLPVSSSSTGEAGNAGAMVWIVNRSNQNWTIQTQSSQLFNGVAAKTSFTLPAGQMALLISDGTGYGGGLFGLLP
jgi:hypothetical protein